VDYYNVAEKTGLKNHAHDKDIKRESMTHQNDARIEVTIYQDDVVVRGPVYAIREVDIPMVLSRIFLEYTCVVVVIVVTVGGVIIVMECLVVVVIERSR
jgi:hypothetical protein